LIIERDPIGQPWGIPYEQCQRYWWNFFSNHMVSMTWVIAACAIIWLFSAHEQQEKTANNLILTWYPLWRSQIYWGSSFWIDIIDNLLSITFKNNVKDLYFLDESYRMLGRQSFGHCGINASRCGGHRSYVIIVSKVTCL
jgi:hypothetical protein